MDLGRQEDALIEIETALEKGDAGVGAYRTKSRILLSLGRLQEALSSSVQALHYDRTDISTQNLVGEIAKQFRKVGAERVIFSP